MSPLAIAGVVVAAAVLAEKFGKFYHPMFGWVTRKQYVEYVKAISVGPRAQHLARRRERYQEKKKQQSK